MKNSSSFDVEAFGAHFRLTAEGADACATLDQYAFPWLERVEAKAGKPDAAIRIDQAAGEFRLGVDDAVVATAAEPLGLVRPLIQVLDERVVHKLTTLRAVHAGAVLCGGRVLLFPGLSHAGKSSLVREMVQRGATYFSDEYALIDTEGLVHPYPRPLLVRNGSPEQSPVLARELNARIGDTPAPVGWIFAIHYVPGCEWSVSPVSQGEALMTLLKNTPHPLAESPQMVSTFQRAVAAASCLAGQRNEAAEAATRIMEMIGG